MPKFTFKSKEHSQGVLLIETETEKVSIDCKKMDEKGTALFALPNSTVWRDLGQFIKDFKIDKQIDLS